MRQCWLRAALVAVAVGSLPAGCSPAAESPRGSETSTPALSSATGALHGTVRLAGTEIPETPLIENTTDPEICGTAQPVHDLLVNAENRGVANAIVALRNVSGEYDVQAESSRLLLDNRDCEFVPRVAVLTVGSTIEAVSHDAVLHTTHLYGALERNLALPGETASATVTVDKPGMIAVLCDVHGWMKAFVRVDSHPFHAVTDAAGVFAIGNIPVGSYEVEIWHERLGTQTSSVRIEPEARVALEVTYALGGR